MTESTDNQTPINTEELLLMLRRKEGNWVEWGKACQQLQKAALNPQDIFEATGFEPIHQNQIIVAAQVFESMMSVGIAPATQAHYQRVGSDSLYELRILSTADRAATADYLFNRNIDSEGSKEVAKAFKEFSYMRQPPEGFSHHPGDAIAYQYWRYVKQKADLADKTRLIARGLMFAHTQSARNQIEKLLTELTAKPQRQAPTLPMYRLEADEELPRTFPLVGSFPLASSVLTTVPKVEGHGEFQITSNNWTGGWVSLPGWQVLCKAERPIAILADEENSPLKMSGHSKVTILVLDISATEWDEFNYFAIDRDGQLAIEWFESAPSIPILGKLLLILQPKSPVERGHAQQDIWEMDD
jgi:Rubisco accumulation factor 1 alpha helical domain/Rubisco Assembly chaperone C-terminal domain/Rubisco accumulation factor 1 helix turn helix domain